MFSKIITEQLAIALQICALFVQFIIFTISILSALALIWLLFTRYYFIPVIYCIWLIYDEFWLQSSCRDGHLLPFMRKLYMWRIMADYFPVRLFKTVDLDPSGNYLFASHPHGHFGHGYICSFATEAANFSQLFPGIKRHVLTVNCFFKWPFLREWLLLCGGGSVNAESIEYKLKLGPGHSVYLVVGGAEEILLARPGDYYLHINKRKGFIRLALKTGAAVVPVFNFGEHRQFELGEWKEGSFGYWFAVVADKLWGVKMPNIYGRWSYFWGALPFGKPINHVVGAPLKFDKAKLAKLCKNEREMVDICHAMYLSALRKLFDDNKARFGESDKQLIFT